MPFETRQQHPAIFMQFSHSSFTGKELDSETGFHYFGARYYDSDLSGLFLSVDPMSDKYPNLSPYAYCAWNPVKLVDPDGREVYITGDAAEQATRQLSSRGITVARDEKTGQLSYTTTGKRLSENDKRLMDAIDSKDVRVNVNATNAQTVPFEDISLNNTRWTGQFLGVSVSDCDNRTAETSQLVNPSICEKRDNDCNVPLGTSLLHEITESYEAGMIAIAEGTSWGPNWRECNGFIIENPANHVYNRAHKKATLQATDAAPVIQARRNDANYKIANILLGMSRQQWDRLEPLFRPHF